VVIRRVAPDSPYDRAEILAVLSLEQPEFTWSRVTLRLRDRLQELETRKLQPNRYAGTNVAPAGLEGGEADLKGRLKPLAFGRLRNVTAVCVNAARLIYQVNDGSIASVPAAYDRGAELSRGADYADRVEMEAVSPAPGFYRIWRNGGFLRLGSPPTGLLTADVVADGGRSAAQILLAMATGAGGVASENVVAADVAALDAANPAELGLWIDADVSVREAMERVANSVGAWFGFDRLGRLRMRRLEAPSGLAVATLTKLSARAAPGAPGDVLSIERRPTEDPGRGVPADRVRLTYQRNWTAQDSDLAGVVAAARREFLRQPSRTAIAEDASVRLRYRGAVQRDFDSLIDDPAAAQTECDRRLALHRVGRDRLIVRVAFDVATAASLDLGASVQLILPRFGLEAGKLFTVIGLDYDAAAGVADIDLWG
jgi:hypothetical protein